MNLTPSFREAQLPNLEVANARLHLEVSQARDAEAEWRNRCQARDALINRVRRALIERDDKDEAIRLLSGATP